jgi:hypothetical protein
MADNSNNNSKIELTTLIFGLFTLVVAGVMLFHFPLKADLADGFTTPIIAFEFATTAADLDFLTGSADSAVSNRAMMDAGHQWDMLFPFAYGGFIALLIFKLIATDHKWLWPFLLMAGLIIPFDINENLTLLAITDALAQGDDTGELLAALHIATRLKLGAIALTVGGFALGLLINKRYFGAIVSAAAAFSIGQYWVFSSHAQLAELMSILLSIFFIWFLVESWLEWWRSRQ